jgi:hypothetical protein
MTCDERMLSCPRIDRASLLTLDGRAAVPCRFGAYQEARLDRIRGPADRLYRTGTFSLACTVDAPAPTPSEPDEYLGVALGLVNLATTAAGEIINQGRGRIHAHVTSVRARDVRLRAKLPKEQARRAKRRLQKRSGRERRLARDTNHCLSKALVPTATDPSRGMAKTPRVGWRWRS